MTTDFCGNGYSKNRLICDCAGEPTILLPNSLLHLANNIDGFQLRDKTTNKPRTIANYGSCFAIQ